jgi:hypothetical protein
VIDAVPYNQTRQGRLSMVKVLVILLLFGGILACQNSNNVTTECDFAPLKIGNSWIYKTFWWGREQGWDSSYLFLTITDTINYENKKAFIFTRKDSIFGGSGPPTIPYIIEAMDTVVETGDSIKVVGPAGREEFPEVECFHRHCYPNSAISNTIVNHESRAAVHLKNVISENYWDSTDLWLLQNVGLATAVHTFSYGTNTGTGGASKELVSFNSEPISLQSIVVSAGP